MASVTPGSPPKPSSPRTSSRRTAKHEPTTEGPGSPSRRLRVTKPALDSSGRLQKTTRGTFLEGSTVVEKRDPEESQDSNDLSFLSTHAPRASMVENMALALDAFSSKAFGDAGYTPRSNSYESPTVTRNRGHTFSSSMSSEADFRDSRPIPTFKPSIPPRIARRDSTKYHKNMQKLPSIFGEDEDSVRAKVYDAQRAEHPTPKPRPRKNTRGKSSTGSASSSIDLGHLAAFQGRLGPAGNRRSRSFDFGSYQRPSRELGATPGTIDVAPTPVVFSGPEAQSSPTKASFTNTSVARKNSVKSSRSQHVRKARAGTLGTAAIKNKPGDIALPMPLSKLSANTHSTAEGQPSTTSPHEATFPIRPGFFRRVFGSSKPAAIHNDPTIGGGSARPSHDVPAEEPRAFMATPSKLQHPIRTSSDLTANKENHPVIAKKPSSFFRRRKKSIANNAPPPLPLNLNAGRFQSQPGEPSPVSSLRAFMDPYLGADAVPSPSRAIHARKDSNQSFHTPTAIKVPADLSKEHIPRPFASNFVRPGSQASLKEPQRSATTASLRLPRQETFLADSSSTVEPSNRSPHQISPVPDLDGRESRSKLNEPNAQVSSSTSLTPHRPPVHDRQGSWVSDNSVRVESGTSESQPADAEKTAQPQLDGAEDSKASSILDVSQKSKAAKSGSSPKASTSDLSDYRSAPSTPLVTEATTKLPSASPFVHVSHPSISEQPMSAEKQKARKIYDNADDELNQSAAAAWLGDAGADHERVRLAFMQLFDFTHLNILASLRSLCARIVLKGETQQMDRLLDAFAQRWCECNSSHGFKSSDVVHTICYSILLLNTDLHLADIGQKMTKNQFVRNAMPTVKNVAEEGEGVSRVSTNGMRSPTFPVDDSTISEAPEQEQMATLRLEKRPVDRMQREESDVDVTASNGGPLIEASYTGSERGWDAQIEIVLRSFYSSIAQEPLPLFGSADAASVAGQSSNLLSIGSMLRRTPSTLSKAHSETNRGRLGSEARSLGARWVGKARSRPRLPSAAGFGSSKTSLDEASSGWSPSLSSTWSKNSLGKTLTSMSVDSFGTEATHQDYQSSIGFANALSQAIIRDDQFEIHAEEGPKTGPLLEDESLELCGAPWAKEGILKHKCHLEGLDKRSKDRNWNDCFAVIEKGWMRLFSFSLTAKSLRHKARNQKTGAVVGGGNWQDNAEEVWKFMLRHAIASALPPPGYSKTRPYVWALSLPTGAVHLFSVGTPDIVKEYCATANYWSARLSKEPMIGGVSNMEYGWSDAMINRALTNEDKQSNRVGLTSPRPSTQLSMRSSLDHGSAIRPKPSGDRAYISEWQPPQQSMFASQLLEVDQLKALQTYVQNVEEELQKHNELRGPMLMAFLPKHINHTRAMGNWEKKSSYLLREIVKFRTYIDTLQNAQGSKEKILKMRHEEEEARRMEDDSAAMRGVMI